MMTRHLTERGFLARHSYFDIGEFITSFEWRAPGQTVEHNAAYKDRLTPHRALIDEMSGVFGRLAAGPETDGNFDDLKIADLLTNRRQTGTSSRWR